MKHIKTVLILCLAALMLVGCASNPAPEAADPSPSVAAVEPEPTEAPVSPEPEEDIPPISEFNAEKKTLYVTGSGSFDQTLVPEEVKGAEYLDVQSKLFRLSVYLPILNVSADTLPAYLPSYIDRTDKSFRFIRSYLMENAPDLYTVMQILGEAETRRRIRALAESARGAENG